MTESAAPIQYFFKRYATATDLVNIDIGGGLQIFAFAKDKKQKSCYFLSDLHQMLCLKIHSQSLMIIMVSLTGTRMKF